MRLFISNAFSLSMLDRDAQAGNDVRLQGQQRIPKPVGIPTNTLAMWREPGDEIVSIVGHADTARLFETILGIPVPVNRQSIKLLPSDRLLVGQYIGPRLPEGATTLPEGARIEWWLI